jgi:hypothetical protein
MNFSEKMSFSVISSSSSQEESSTHGKVERRHAKGAKCLPCFTHISTGACIYGDFCRFIHDRNLSSHSLPNTTLEQRNNVDHKIRDDPIYWPPAFNPHVMDEYTLDHKIVFHDDLRYKSIYSMWSFFIGAVSNSNEDWPNYSQNPLTKRERLPVFQQLAEGVPVTKDSEEQSLSVSYARIAKSSAQPRKITSFRNKQSIFNASLANIAPRHVARMSA